MRRTLVALVVIVGMSACAKAEDRLGRLEARFAELEQESREEAAREAKTKAALAAMREESEAMKVQLARLNRLSGAMVEAEIGIRVCDAYIADYTKCIDEKVPEVARLQMHDALQQTRRAWQELAAGPDREGLAVACMATADAAKQATAAMGCEFSSL